MRDNNILKDGVLMLCIWHNGVRVIYGVVDGEGVREGIGDRIREKMSRWRGEGMSRGRGRWRGRWRGREGKGGEGKEGWGMV